MTREEILKLIDYECKRIIKDGVRNNDRCIVRYPRGRRITIPIIDDCCGLEAKNEPKTEE